ncbi:MAG: hypothetical protein DMG88_16380 [Acidobacteria bacterium]|nr:MAG: hypothetical protein DMG88_16380 [Acidobacteriota bacterium]
MLAYIFVVVALAVRFMPHPWTFTPVVASLLFFGARGRRRRIWIPWVLLAASDVVLTKLVYHYPFFTWDHYVTWAWYAAILWLGTKLRESTKPLHVIGAALASSVSFYLISNFDVWAATNLYPKTFAGLMTSYTLALPFFRNAVEGDLLFTAVMFATPIVLHKFAETVGQGDHTAAA